MERHLEREHGIRIGETINCCSFCDSTLGRKPTTHTCRAGGTLNALPTRQRHGCTVCPLSFPSRKGLDNHTQWHRREQAKQARSTQQQQPQQQQLPTLVSNTQDQRGSNHQESPRQERDSTGHSGEAEALHPAESPPHSERPTTPTPTRCRPDSPRQSIVPESPQESHGREDGEGTQGYSASSPPTPTTPLNDGSDPQPAVPVDKWAAVRMTDAPRWTHCQCLLLGTSANCHPYQAW